MLSDQIKSNELQEARDVFIQWLSGHSQTGKYLVDLYRTGFSMGFTIALAIHSLDPTKALSKSSKVYRLESPEP